MNATIGSHNVGATKTHRIGENEVSRFHPARFLCTFAGNFLFGLVDELRADLRISDLNPMLQKTRYKRRRTHTLEKALELDLYARMLKHPLYRQKIKDRSDAFKEPSGLKRAA